MRAYNVFHGPIKPLPGTPAEVIVPWKRQGEYYERSQCLETGRFREAVASRREERPARLLLARLDLRQVQTPRLALIMAGQLLKPAAGMLVLRGDRGGSALLGLLVEESYVVHVAPESAASPKVPRKSRPESQAPDKATLLDEPD